MSAREVLAVLRHGATGEVVRIVRDGTHYYEELEGEPEARLVAFGRRDALDTIARRVGGGYVREVAS